MKKIILGLVLTFAVTMGITACNSTRDVNSTDSITTDSMIADTMTRDTMLRDTTIPDTTGRM